MKIRCFLQFVGVGLCLLLFAKVGAASPANEMKVTVLGSGTPFPDPDRSSAAVLVEAGEEKLLFDCGRGTVVRLNQAGVPVQAVNALFLTHLHFDHTVGIPDLWLTGWLLGRSTPLRIWGPSGTSAMMEHLSQAFSFDVQVRERPPEKLPPEGAKFESQEIEEGPVYVHGPVRVSAFLVDHGTVKPAFGYRVDYSGHSVVISGDTKFSQNLIHFSKGVDCLIHVAWMADSENSTPVALRSLASAEDAGRVFEAVKPKLAVVYHYKDETGMADAIRSRYSGPFVISKDLMVIEIGSKTTWRDGERRAKSSRRSHE